MSKKLLAIVVATVVIASTAYYYLTLQEDQSLTDGLASGNGRVEAVQVDVSTKFSGRVEEILVKEGDLVEVGQRVANMDIIQLKAQQHRALRLT